MKSYQRVHDFINDEYKDEWIKAEIRLSGDYPHFQYVAIIINNLEHFTLAEGLFDIGKSDERMFIDYDVMPFLNKVKEYKNRLHRPIIADEYEDFEKAFISFYIE